MPLDRSVRRAAQDNQQRPNRSDWHGEAPRTLTAATDHALESQYLIAGQMAAAVLTQRLDGKQLGAVHQAVARALPAFTSLLGGNGGGGCPNTLGCDIHSFAIVRGGLCHGARIIIAPIQQTKQFESSAHQERSALRRPLESTRLIVTDSLIRCGAFDVIHHEDINWTLGRFQPSSDFEFSLRRLHNISKIISTFVDCAGEICQVPFSSSIPDSRFQSTRSERKSEWRFTAEHAKHAEQELPPGCQRAPRPSR
jgi:hypothetical protein